MTKTILTAAAIERLPLPVSGETWTGDAKVNGLFVKCTPTGRGFYFYRHSPAINRSIKKKLGNVGEMSLTAARLAAEGLIPSLTTAPAPKVKIVPTISEVARLYEQHLEAQGRRCTSYATDEVNRSWPKLKNRRLDDVTVVELAEEHNLIATTRGRVAAARAIKVMRTIYHYADSIELYEGRNPAKRVKVRDSAKRAVFLLPDEQGVLVRVLESMYHPTNDIHDYFKLLLLTGARRSNVAGMRYADIKGDVWTIPAEESKNGLPLEVVLVAEALTIINGRKGESPWVFPSPKASCGHLVEPYFWLEEVRARMAELGVTKHFYIHDLRRTFATNMTARGASLTVVGKALGHSGALASTGVYARVSTDTVREALNPSSPTPGTLSDRPA